MWIGGMATSNNVCDGVELTQPGYSVYSSLALLFAMLGCVVSLSGSAFLWIYRNTAIIRISQLKLLHWFCAGFLLMNLSGIPSALNSFAPMYDSLCVIHIWMLHSSITFIIAVLTAKEWRTWKLRVYSAKLRRFHITENLLSIYVAFSMCFMWLILTLWTVFQPPAVDPCQSFECSSHGSVWFWLAIAFQSLQCIIMITMAWMDWGMGRVGGESKGIFITSVCLAFVVVGFFVTFVYNPSSNLNESVGHSSAVESMIGYIITFLFTIVAMTAIVFEKYRHVSRSSQEIMTLFLLKNSSTRNEHKSKAEDPQPLEERHSSSAMELAPQRKVSCTVKDSFVEDQVVPT